MGVSNVGTTAATGGWNAAAGGLYRRLKNGCWEQKRLGRHELIP